MIPNFTQVDEFVLRGGRPDSPSDYDTLRSQAVSIVNLEGDDVAGKERQTLVTVGNPFSWLWCPIDPSDIYITGFPWSILEDLQDKIALLPKPAFIHCQHGQDRTGLVVAMYRVRNGMKPEDDRPVSLLRRFHLRSRDGRKYLLFVLA